MSPSSPCGGWDVMVTPSAHACGKGSYRSSSLLMCTIKLPCFTTSYHWWGLFPHWTPLMGVTYPHQTWPYKNNRKGLGSTVDAGLWILPCAVDRSLDVCCGPIAGCVHAVDLSLDVYCGPIARCVLYIAPVCWMCAVYRTCLMDIYWTRTCLLDVCWPCSCLLDVCWARTCLLDVWWTSTCQLDMCWIAPVCWMCAGPAPVCWICAR